MKKKTERKKERKKETQKQNMKYLFVFNSHVLDPNTG